jgi:hypothetical protein
MIAAVLRIDHKTDAVHRVSSFHTKGPNLALIRGNLPRQIGRAGAILC